MPRVLKRTAVREEVEYRGRWFVRYPNSKNRSDRVYFRCLDNLPGLEKYLHRYIYACEVGPVEPWEHVHHKDENPLNNSVENLEKLPVPEHMSLHADAQDKDRLRAHMAAVAPLSKAWHASDEGRAWHQQHGKATWENREPRVVICESCGEPFETMDYKEETRFCSNKCRAKARRESGLDDEQRSCKQCGEPFTCNKYSKQQFCSKGCVSESRRKVDE